jgi:hypothetical protein
MQWKKSTQISNFKADFWDDSSYFASNLLAQFSRQIVIQILGMVA